MLVFGLAPYIHRFLWILSFPMIYCNYGLQIDGEIPKSLALVCWETFLNYLPRQFLTNWRTLSHSCLWTSLSRMPLSHPIIIITCYSPCVLFLLSQLFKKLFAGIKFRMFYVYITCHFCSVNAPHTSNLLSIKSSRISGLIVWKRGCSIVMI